ncbi:MAG: carbohydrate ABC transporter permease [Christensenellales bacterium]|jgi:putative aldouronate transport system permease protein
MRIKKSTDEKIFLSIIYAFMIVFCLTTLFPFWNIITLSFTGSGVSTVKYYLWPPVTTLANYKRVFSSSNIWIGFGNTFFRTIIGTLLTLLFSIHMAYPLSKRNFPHRNIWTLIVVFTMFFSGGMIPDYILVRTLGLINTRWAMILPMLISPFNMIIMRNFFMNIPDSLEESARIDGANDITVLYKIILPISGSIIATIALWTAVSHWNAWFDCLIYINDSSKMVVQTILRRVVLEGSQQLMNMTGYIPGMEEVEVVSTETIKAATIMVATVPILVVYPFLQKYFVKGVMVGSLKG